MFYYGTYHKFYHTLQRYLSGPDTVKQNSSKPHSFPLTATERVLRRMFTIVGDDHRGTHSPKKSSASSDKAEREAQSPPWWRTLPLRSIPNALSFILNIPQFRVTFLHFVDLHSSFLSLKHEVEMIAVSEHRALARQHLLGGGDHEQTTNGDGTIYLPTLLLRWG